ncbi:alanine racemase [Helcococcus kunzii]|uniref:alanine racemase n=1 Tax=Helcococcus kunzii TaxID=40091 RepID=UPI001BB08657|nr:alanine racemase [Helcococcus kunzii]QUY64315.1 alanine racemase [Helcococcus kunzii]
MGNSTNILEVNINKIRNNINILENIAKKKYYAVVKANAYGLGAAEIAKRIEDIVYGYCVATIDEAVELRKAGIKKDIIVLGYILPENYHLLSEYNIITTIYSVDIAREMEKLGKKIRAHIKIETGHNRLGFKPEDKSYEEIMKINTFKNISLEGIFSHLSTADEKDSYYTELQHKRFEEAINALKDLTKNWIKHLSNDAAMIAYDFDYDAVRSGISLYGVYPSEYMNENYHIGLETAFELKSRISFIKEIEKGDSVSYSRTFIAKEKMKIATVSIGYADGYHRLISNRGYVLINGKKAQILGNITMDQMMVDISNIDAQIHDEVVLIGKSGDEEITPEQVANWAETITYEIMTSISPRVKRTYIYEE